MALATRLRLRYGRTMHHARETIRKAGYRLTPQRVAVWEAVRRGGRHRTAEEIAAEVQQTLPEVNVSTVYRTLELLVGLELVQETRLAGVATYYEVAPSPVHHHFVCEGCGAVGHLDDGLLEPVRRELLDADGFLVSEARMTVFGLCRECRGRPKQRRTDDKAATGQRPGGVMHIPDGYLGPETIAAGWAITVPVWYRANRRTKQLLSEPKMIPVLAFGAAFSFLVMMLNVPVAGGTTAHAVGAVLIAVIAGPDIACLAVSAALVIQAFFFGDGGVLTLGVNVLNMAIVMPYAGLAIYRLVAGDSDLQSSRRLWAAGIGAYCGLVAAAFLNSIELGIQPLLHTVNGVAQYFPYGFKTTFPAMVGSHALVVGPIEAAFTVGVFAVLRRQSPELFAAGGTTQPIRRRWIVALLVVFIAAVPLGLLASGGAFAEWDSSELRNRIGYIPKGFARLGGHWHGLLPDYSWNGASGVVDRRLLCRKRRGRRGGALGDRLAR